MRGEDIIAIALQALEGALAQKQRRIRKRITATEELQAEHRSRGRFVEAAGCAIRAQALREAVAILRDSELPALRSFVSQGLRSAETPSPSKPGEN